MKKFLIAACMLATANSFAETLTMGDDYLVGGNSDGRLGQLNYFYTPCREDIVNNFAPLPLLSRKSINTVKCLVSGKDERFTYDGEWLLSIEIRDYQGNIKHLVSKNPIDLTKVNRLQILTPTLSNKYVDRVIEIGEYLALHVDRIGPEPPPGSEYCQSLTLSLYCEADVR